MIIITDGISVTNLSINISKKILFAVALASALAGCANIVEHKTRVFKGENLITPYSGFLSGWRVLVENKENYHSRMWQHPVDGFNDAYVVSVSTPERKVLSQIRSIIDMPGYNSCVKFSTLTLQSTSNSSYPSELWQTHCKKKDGGEAKILHLILQGQDSFYHIQKIWQGNVVTQEIAEWQERFQQIYLCDSRIDKPACPEISSE